MTATLNPYDLYKYDLTMNGTVPGNSSHESFKSVNYGAKDYARFSRRFKNHKVNRKQQKPSNDDPITLQKYMNMADVKSALHIQSNITWCDCCSVEGWEYTE